jgi:hypothetical protein
MTIASSTSRIGYTGDGATTAFAVPFFFSANSDLVVSVQDLSGNVTTKLLGTDYNLSGAGVSTGGTCTFVVAPTTGFLIAVTRVPPLTQTTSYNNNDPFPAKSHEGALDKLTTITQYLKSLVDRTMQVAPTDTPPMTTLPPATVRALKNFTFDSLGNPSVSTPVTGTTVSSALIPVVTASTLAIARTLLGVDAAIGAAAGTPGGRLTLTSGVAVTGTDVTGATLVYYTPAVSNQIPIAGLSTTFAELSNNSVNSAVGNAGPAVVAANSMYDFYVWSNAGTVTLTRSPAWVSDTSRGTGAGTAERQLTNGFYTNKFAITNGPGAGLGVLVGTARSDGTSQFTDSLAKRWLSNIYQATPRAMSVPEATASWTYAAAAWRQARATASNQLDFVQAVGGNALSARVAVCMSNSGITSFAVAGIGINSTTTNSAMFAATQMLTASQIMPAHAFFSGVAQEGRTFAAWLEYSATGTTSYSGTASLLQSGIMGEIIN